MPQQTSTFQGHFKPIMQDVVGTYHKLKNCLKLGPHLTGGWIGKSLDILLSQGNCNMARSKNQPTTSKSRGGLDSSVGSGLAPWPRGRGFEPQPSTVRAPTGWVGVSIM
ncbi:hypothetical protein ElyMa_005330700 [Elysia marginata]|uniref:Uncharacterized protein n=1 Tax=Elysia marginata TaxID=1093978 RepID=A0AAV4JZA6_9GAST|nr:hypothetical protein ElyMa_005330700 [Elysia marginata]